MKKIQIYEPAMCCPTGLCGVGVDKELLRISSILSIIERKGFLVERFNLSNAPETFISNKKVNDLLMTEGEKSLPVVLIDGEIVKTKSYPSNEELSKWLSIDLVASPFVTI